jgi:hypothetical protein
VAFSLIASVVAYAAIVAGGNASNKVAEEKTAAEGGKPAIARGRSPFVSDDPLPDIDLTSSVPEMRKTPASPVKEYRKPKRSGTALPPPQPSHGGSPPASRLDNALIPQQADEPAMAAKYETPNVLRRDDWNDYMIRCRGRRVQLSINGHRAIDYAARDESASPLAVIGLQIQVGPASEAGNTDIVLIGEVAPCELSVPSGQGTHSLAGTERPFLSPSPCFGGKETDEQDGTCVKWQHTGRSAVEDVGTSSIRFVENPTPRLTLPCRKLDDSTAPAQWR